MQHTEVTWVICEDARQVAGELKSILGDEKYEDLRSGLKEFICAYFSAVESCNQKQGKSISPMKTGVPNAKGMKVRFGYPGCGKRGGLRIAVLAFCSERLVKIAGAWIRRDDPDDDDFDTAFKAS